MEKTIKLQLQQFSDHSDDSVLSDLPTHNIRKYPSKPNIPKRSHAVASASNPLVNKSIEKKQPVVIYLLEDQVQINVSAVPCSEKKVSDQVCEPAQKQKEDYQQIERQQSEIRPIVLQDEVPSYNEQQEQSPLLNLQNLRPVTVQSPIPNQQNKIFFQEQIIPLEDKELAQERIQLNEKQDAEAIVNPPVIQSQQRVEPVPVQQIAVQACGQEQQQNRRQNQSICSQVRVEVPQQLPIQILGQVPPERVVYEPQFSIFTLLQQSNNPNPQGLKLDLILEQPSQNIQQQSPKNQPQQINPQQNNSTQNINPILQNIENNQPITQQNQQQQQPHPIQNPPISDVDFIRAQIQQSYIEIQRLKQIQKQQLKQKQLIKQRQKFNPNVSYIPAQFPVAGFFKKVLAPLPPKKLKKKSKKVIVPKKKSEIIEIIDLDSDSEEKRQVNIRESTIIKQSNSTNQHSNSVILPPANKITLSNQPKYKQPVQIIPSTNKTNPSNEQKHNDLLKIINAGPINSQDENERYLNAFSAAYPEQYEEAYRQAYNEVYPENKLNQTNRIIQRKVHTFRILNNQDQNIQYCKLNTSYMKDLVEIIIKEEARYRRLKKQGSVKLKPRPSYQRTKTTLLNERDADPIQLAWQKTTMTQNILSIIYCFTQITKQLQEYPKMLKIIEECTFEELATIEEQIRESMYKYMKELRFLCDSSWFQGLADKDFVERIIGIPAVDARKQIDQIRQIIQNQVRGEDFVVYEESCSESQQEYIEYEINSGRMLDIKNPKPTAFDRISMLVQQTKLASQQNKAAAKKNPTAPQPSAPSTTSTKPPTQEIKRKSVPQPTPTQKPIKKQNKTNERIVIETGVYKRKNFNKPQQPNFNKRFNENKEKQPTTILIDEDFDEQPIMNFQFGCQVQQEPQLKQKHIKSGYFLAQQDHVHDIPRYFYGQKQKIEQKPHKKQSEGPPIYILQNYKQYQKYFGPKKQQQPLKLISYVNQSNKIVYELKQKSQIENLGKPKKRVHVQPSPSSDRNIKVKPKPLELTSNLINYIDLMQEMTQGIHNSQLTR